jgi:ABC-2 type transport system permease protein
MRAAVHAEWTKLRTVAGPGWLLLAAVVLTTALSAVAVAATSCPDAGCAVDPTKLSLTGVLLGQAVVAVHAVLVVGTEYSTGTIRTTVTAVPRRGTVLSAKAVTATMPVVLVSALAVLGSLLAGRVVQAGHGLPPVLLTEGPTLRAAVGSVLYLALICLLSLGLATAVRSSAVAVGIVLGLLYLFPVLLTVVTDPDWKRHIQQISPSNAGLAIQATTDVGNLPISPWAGLGVLAAWAAAALMVGGLAFRLRDA